MKIYKAQNIRENYCKNLHKEANMHLGPTRLENMNLFVLVDTDELQKQVNRMEYQMYMDRRVRLRRAWIQKARTGRRR